MHVHKHIMMAGGQDGGAVNGLVGVVGERGVKRVFGLKQMQSRQLNECPARQCLRR